MFVRAAQMFNYPQEDMSYGWLVPIFSGYALWTVRRELRAAAGAPSVCGFLASLPFYALALLGTRGLQLRFEQVGFIGLCITLPWAFYGRRVAKLCLFPALYLVFTIPVSSFLDVVTIHLRLIASGTALAVLKGIGFDVVQRGTALIATGAHPFSIDVAEPCSGLRSLFALMALTAAYAWYNQPTWLRRAALFACAVPLAVLGNVVRVLTICLVAATADPDFAMGFYHDYSGYVVFLVAISLMVACGEAITRLATRGRMQKGDERQAALPPQPEAACSNPWRRCLPWVFAGVVAALAIFQAMTPDSTVMESPPVSLPAELRGYHVDTVRYCQNDQCGRVFECSRLTGDACPVCGGKLTAISLGEKTLLPEDTRLEKRLYRAPSGVEFLVSAVTGGTSKRSIHRPELCLPAQGYTMRAPYDFAVGTRPYHAVGVTPPRGDSSALAYTFFNQDGMRTASHLRRIFRDTWDRSVYNRVDRWVMVTVHVSAPMGFDIAQPETRAVLEAFLTLLEGSLP